MSAFDDQINQRMSLDDELFEESFLGLASVVMGKKVIAQSQDDKILLKSALDDILKFYRIKPQPIPDSMTELSQQLDFLTQSSGVMRRTVHLTDRWYDESIGPYLAFKQTGEAVALLPQGASGFSYLDYSTGKRVSVTKANASDFLRDAICFYKPFPSCGMGRTDLLRFMHGALLPSDVRKIALVLLATALTGVITIYFSEQLIWQTIKPEPYLSFVYLVAMIALSMMLSITLKAISRRLIQRTRTRVGASVQSALMMRILSLPTEFFRQFSSGELASRATYINTYCDTVIDTFLFAVPSFLLTMLYLLYLAYIAADLVPFVLVEVTITLAFSVACLRAKKRNLTERLAASSKTSGVSHTMITGIQKIRIAGAEKRAFAKWSSSYQRSAEIAYNPPAIAKASSFIPKVIPLFFCVVYYSVAAQSVSNGMQSISSGEYYTFTLLYGALNVSLVALFSQLMRLAESSAAFELARPIFEATPEVSGNKKPITKLSGRIEVSHASFRYDKDMPYLFRDLSIKINPGEYVAVVGKSGCGKSTLLRLLLGFESPEKGAVYYDGQDLSKIDLESLRRRIGTVMQGGKLFLGDIYYNIIISAPWLTVDDAWEAAETAGIADDIRAMPMGMQTLISEDQNGISGGQRQRLVIARAIAQKPKILLLDEATSALDNVTQRKVAESLASLHCTRVVIAHRLSTVRACDRILVIDDGRIAEEGTYDELIEQGGIFSDLVSRQQLDAVPAHAGHEAGA
jgi:NHLM bacteriocin system ABC transporter ATP-binding protein